MTILHWYAFKACFKNFFFMIDRGILIRMAVAVVIQLSFMGVVLALISTSLYRSNYDTKYQNNVLKTSVPLAGIIEQGVVAYHNKRAATVEHSVLHDRSFYLIAPQSAQGTYAKRLMKVGMRSSVSRDKADVILTQQADLSWKLQTPVSHDALFIQSTLQTALSLQRPTVKDIRLSMNEQNWQYLSEKTKTGVVLFGLRGPLIFLLIASGLTSTVGMMALRSNGTLEPFALSPVPFPVYLLAQNLAETLHVSFVTLAMLLASCLFIPFPGFFNLASFWVIITAFVLILKTMGSTHILLFRHQWSYFIGAILLNPVVVILLLLIRFFWVIFTQKTIEHDDVWHAFMLPGAAFFTLVITALILVFYSWLLNWRLGYRRYGLTKI